MADEYVYNAWGERIGPPCPPDDVNKPLNSLRFVGKSGYHSDDARVSTCSGFGIMIRS